MRAFFQNLRARVLGDPPLVVSDGAPEIIRAIEECFPRLAPALPGAPYAQPRGQGPPSQWRRDFPQNGGRKIPQSGGLAISCDPAWKSDSLKRGIGVQD